MRCGAFVVLASKEPRSCCCFPTLFSSHPSFRELEGWWWWFTCLWRGLVPLSAHSASFGEVFLAPCVASPVGAPVLCWSLRIPALPALPARPGSIPDESDELGLVRLDLCMGWGLHGPCAFGEWGSSSGAGTEPHGGCG